jgi:hypothetical protein
MNPALDRAHQRRGVLMLVVVSMLTLFLMLGTTYLVVAARAKQAARAHARLAMDSPSTGIAPARLLDAVLLKTVRGGFEGVSEPVANGGVLAGLSCSGTFESLLADKYGDGLTKTGIASAIASISGSSSSPLLTCTLQVSGFQAADLPGRVLTILGSNREPTSHRILSGSAAGGNSFSVLLSTASRRRAFVMPTPPVDVVLNGLEFDGIGGNEPYDAFDDKNVFLTHVSPKDKANSVNDQTVSGSKVWRFGYLSSGTNPTLRTLSGSTSSTGLPYGADNDNDGTPDGFFLDFGLPSVPAPNGAGTVDFHASVLIVDLDSRFNVNAHGSLASLTYPTGTATANRCPGWPTGTDAPSPGTIPIGSGYGPAEVNGALMFPGSAYSATESSRRMRGPDDPDYTGTGGGNDDDYVVPSFSYLLSGADASSQTLQRRPNTSRFNPKHPLPRMNAMEGKYGEGQDPTKFVRNSTDVPKSQSSGTWARLADNTFPLSRPGAPNTNDTLSLIRDANATPTASNAVTNAGAGVPSVWWDGAASYSWAPVSGTSPRGAYNSPPDLHGSMLTTTSTAHDVVPRLIFAKPDWSSGETTDDPYELRLDSRSARNGSMTTTGTAWDNVFGYADLEAVLRQYDLDAQRLPRRLLQILGPASEEARLRVTTDSWDTTMITGTAATTIRTRLNATGLSLSGTSATTGIVANEVARGERLNLNRPLTSDKPAAYDATDSYYVQRQALFKDIYTLLTIVGGTATPNDRAQWAANAVEFRDADSTITPFEYDPNPFDGWRPDGDVRTDEGAANRKVVWGAERPEILIREAFSWSNTGDGSGGVVLSLHRAWNARAMARVSGSNTTIAAEPCDDNLDTLSSGTGGRPLNQVDLGRKANADHSNFDDVSATRFPTWRIRIVAGGSTQYIRLDSGSAAASNEFVIGPSALADGASKPKMAVDTTLTLASNTSIKTGTGTLSGTASISLSGSAVVIPNLKVSATGTVFLERLADLTCVTGTGKLPGQLSGGNVTGQDVWDATPADIGADDTTRVPQRYIVVDSCQLPWVDTKAAVTPATVSQSSFIRTVSSTSTAYWGPATPAVIPFVIGSGTTLAMPTAISGSSSAAAWFVWPNRPFVSAAELLLVPKGDAVGMLSGYAKPKVDANGLLTITGTTMPLFMDSVHVPTRFAAIHTTINASGTSTLDAKGIYAETTPVNQISAYREPGRVNLNTITSDDVWNAVVAGPLTASGTANPVKTRSAVNFADSPATSFLSLLSLSSSGTTVIKDGDSDLTAMQPRNPLHEIYTATRLANTATTRSNVFAIWITVRASIAGDPDSVKLHRGFYIVDRSIPVAYEPGKDHNVWDCVVLRRIIE